MKKDNSGWILLLLLLLLRWKQQPAIETSTSVNVSWTQDKDGNWIPVPLVSPPEPVEMPIKRYLP